MGAGCQGLVGPDTHSVVGTSGAALLSLCLFCQISPSSQVELSSKQKPWGASVPEQGGARSWLDSLSVEAVRTGSSQSFSAKDEGDCA